MAITSCVVNSFKTEMLKGLHSFDTSGATPAGNVFKIALYTSSATLGTTTTAYSATNEISGSGYSAGGNTLTNTGVGTTTTTSFTDFSDTSWTSASFTARGCLIYNSTNANKAVCAINFGANKTVTSGTFTIQFPAQTAGNAIIQIA